MADNQDLPLASISQIIETLVTSELFEAYLVCPTKCFLLASAEFPPGNDFTIWSGELRDSYLRTGLQRLLEFIQTEPWPAMAELCELALQQLAGRTEEGPRDIVISEVGGPVASGGFLRMRLVVKWVGLGFVVCLIFETFVAGVHAIAGASTPDPQTAEKHGFPTGEIR